MRRKAWARPELMQCPYFVDAPREQKGKWHQWFPKDQPIHLELGCGKGVFLAELALRHPDINYIGVDLSSDVLGVAHRNIEASFLQENRPVKNIALLAHDIERILLMMDAQDTVERIYINFCNPWPKGKHHKKRLTHSRQLELYKNFLVNGGEIHFKTDDAPLYRSTLFYFEQSGFQILRKTEDLYAENWQENIVSEHEQKFTALGMPIHAIQAKWIT